MRVDPSELTDVISVIPAMRPSVLQRGRHSRRHRFGLTEGSDACMDMVGKIDLRQRRHGRRKKAIIPVKDHAAGKQRRSDRPVDEGA